eukprot:6173752-Pleurochrysis_carterae.AAC.6
MTKQKLDKKRFLNKDAARGYAKVVTQRIQYQFIKLKKHHQSRLHGDFETTQVSKNMTDILESIGAFN